MTGTTGPEKSGPKFVEFHRLSDIDAEQRLGTCSVCGPTRVAYREQIKKGKLHKFWQCHESNRRRVRRYLRPWREGIAKDVCARCGFIPEDPAQMDVDHIVRRADGGTDVAENLQVYCANCHRSKSAHENRGTMDQFELRYTPQFKR